MDEVETYDNLAIEGPESNSGKISVVESVVIVLISLSGDFADLFGAIALSVAGGTSAAIGWIPIVGQIGAAAATGVGTTMYFLSKGFSLFVWTTITLWAGFRNAKGGMSAGKKVLSLFAGKGIDELTFGIMPIQTMSVIFAIFYNNSIKKNDTK